MNANLDLYERIKDGDEDAFARFLWTLAQPKLWYRVKKRSPGLQDADLEDLSAEWICKLLLWYRTGAHPFPSSVAALTSFCLVVGDRLLMDRVRRDQRMPMQPDPIALELAIGVGDAQESAWPSLMAQLRAIPRDGLSPGMARAYEIVVDLIHDRMRWPSTREIADRLGLSVSRASRLKTRVQFWMRSHMAFE